MGRYLILIAVLVFVPACKDKYDYYVREGVVTSVGACGGGEGYFSGSYQCAVMADVKGESIRLTVYKQAVKGQRVYQLCWKEESGGWCEGNAYSEPLYRWRRLGL